MGDFEASSARTNSQDNDPISQLTRRIKERGIDEKSVFVHGGSNYRVVQGALKFPSEDKPDGWIQLIQDRDREHVEQRGQAMSLRKLLQELDSAAENSDALWRVRGTL